MHNPILYNWKIGGEAGQGIMNTGGPIFSKTMTRAGFFVFVYSEYPSLIRGGHNTQQVAVDVNPIKAAYFKLNQLVALNSFTIISNQDEVLKGGAVIYNSCSVKIKRDGLNKFIKDDRPPSLSGVYTVGKSRKKVKLRPDVNYVPVEFDDIAQDVGGNKIMRNVAAIGAAIKVFENDIKKRGGYMEILEGVLKDVFCKKGKDIIDANIRVARAGYEVIGS